MVLAGVLVAAAVAVVLILTVGSSGGAKNIHVTGTMELTDSEGFFSSSGQAGQSCYGTDGYDDITAGAEVVITDDTDKALVITDLGPGSVDADGGCQFEFDTTVPAGKKFYGVTVTHRGTVKETEGEMQAPAITLG